MVNRQITLASRPEGFPKESDFALVEGDVPSAGPGEVLVRSQWLSLDPYMRGRMSTARSYAKPTEVGEPMTGQAVGEVVESQDPRFAAGDTVVGQLGWQDYAVARGGSLRKLDPALAPPQTALHVLGATGLTAYFGLFDVGAGEAGRHRRRLRCIRGGRPGRRPARQDRRLRPGRRARRVGREGRRPHQPLRLRRRHRLQARRRQRAAQGGVPERRRRLLRQRRRRALGNGLPPARARGPRPGLRAGLAVQPGRAGAGAAQPRLPDRLPRPARGFPDLRLRPSLPRGPAAPRPLARRGQAHLPRGRDRGPRERSRGVHRHAQRREPRQDPRQAPLASRRFSISALAGACATSPLAGSPATSSGSSPSRPVDGIAERPLLLNIA